VNAQQLKLGLSADPSQALLAILFTAVREHACNTLFPPCVKLTKIFLNAVEDHLDGDEDKKHAH
jgi:hypothetical protein